MGEKESTTKYTKYTKGHEGNKDLWIEAFASLWAQCTWNKGKGTLQLAYWLVLQLGSARVFAQHPCRVDLAEEMDRRSPSLPPLFNSVETTLPLLHYDRGQNFHGTLSHRARHRPLLHHLHRG